MSKRLIVIIAIIIAFMATPVFVRAQDCCGPGGGDGGGSPAIAAVAESGGYVYRLKNVRHYAYSARHPGLIAGIEGGGITDGGNANISPRLERHVSVGAGSLGSFDMYGGAFYTVFFEKPHSHQLDLAGNIAWRLAPDEDSRLAFRLDNEYLAVFFPDKMIFAYAVLDAGAAYSRVFGFGDISVSAGFPVLFKPESGLDSWLALGYEHPIGLGVSVCPRLALLPDAEYSGTAFTLSFAWDRFFVKAAFAANRDFTAFSISPYAEFALGHIFFWAGADFGGLGSGDVSASPFIGAAYCF
ncbi:MAG: hypothetical protein LBD58_09665 [Treponema sp.]|jgi:hypothetical protein|nr:hypothetical protein [Treponema sp.]